MRARSMAGMAVDAQYGGYTTLADTVWVPTICPTQLWVPHMVNTWQYGCPFQNPHSGYAALWEPLPGMAVDTHMALQGAWSLPIWWMHGNVGAQYMPSMHRYGYPYGGSTTFWMPFSCHSSTSTSSMIQHLQYQVCTIGVNRGCARD